MQHKIGVAREGFAASISLFFPLIMYLNYNLRVTRHPEACYHRMTTYARVLSNPILQTKKFEHNLRFGADIDQESVAYL